MEKIKYELQYEAILRDRHINRYNEAAANSLNVIVPFTVYPQMHWTRDSLARLHSTVRRALQIFVMENRKALLYDKNIHKDLDVLSYLINRSERPEKEKDLLTQANLVRMSQNSDEFLVSMRKRILDYKRTDIAREEKLVSIDPGFKGVGLEVPKDTFRLEVTSAGKELIPIGPTMLLFKSAEELAITEVQDIQRKNGNSYDPIALAQALTYLQKEDILYMDTEYEEIRQDSLWMRRTLELAIINDEGYALYHATSADEIDREQVLRILQSRVVLIKGVAAEVDYIYGVHNECRTTQDHAKYLKECLNKKLPCFIMDLELFGVPKYDKQVHHSLSEILYFKEHFNEKIIFYQQQYRNIQDAYERRRIDIMIYRLLYMMVTKDIPGTYVALSDYHQSFISNSESLGVIQRFAYEDVSSFDYQTVLWKLYYETKYYYYSMPCYLHNLMKCRRCVYYRLKFDLTVPGSADARSKLEKNLTLYNDVYSLWVGSNYYDLMPTVASPRKPFRFLDYIASIDFKEEWKNMLSRNIISEVVGSGTKEDYTVTEFS